MRKLISLTLALILVLSLSTAAFAAEQDLSDHLDKDKTFTKEYVIGNGTAPAETFSFNVEYKSFKDNEGNEATATTVPTVTLGTAAFESNVSATATATATVAISDYANAPLGVYTYEITETAGNTAGVTYNTEKIYLVVTILNNEDTQNHYVAAIHYKTANGSKTDKITNTYEAGKLTVTKDIEGNMADMDKEFPFTIVLTAPAGTVFNSTVQNVIDNNGAKAVYSDAKNSVTITVDLGEQESINITNIPVGTTYTISEVAGNYASENTTAADGSIANNDEDVSVWTNTLSSEVDTGISLDNMPYILMLGFCAVAAVLFVTKRRAY